MASTELSPVNRTVVGLTCLSHCSSACASQINVLHQGRPLPQILSLGGQWAAGHGRADDIDRGRCSEGTYDPRTAFKLVRQRRSEGGERPLSKWRRAGDCHFQPERYEIFLRLEISLSRTRIVPRITTSRKVSPRCKDRRLKTIIRVRSAEASTVSKCWFRWACVWRYLARPDAKRKNPYRIQVSF